MHEEVGHRVMSVEKLVLASSVTSFYAPSSAGDLCSPTSDYSRTNSLLTSPSSVEDISDFSTDFDTDSDSFDRPNESSPLPYYIKGRASLDLNDTAMSTAVFCFVKNYVGVSGSSTVAIDNKIEQAMDLVKSQLMFAVREEVEVLKERIAELIDRIAFLESENTVLRAGASQETLALLSQMEPPFPASGSDNASSGCGSGNSQGPPNGTSAP